MAECKRCGRDTEWDGDPAKALCLSCWDRETPSEQQAAYQRAYREAHREQLAYREEVAARKHEDVAS